jgi:hypothetical protein
MDGELNQSAIPSTEQATGQTDSASASDAYFKNRSKRLVLKRLMMLALVVVVLILGSYAANVWFRNSLDGSWRIGQSWTDHIEFEAARGHWSVDSGCLQSYGSYSAILNRITIKTEHSGVGGCTDVKKLAALTILSGLEGAQSFSVSGDRSHRTLTLTGPSTKLVLTK